MEFCCLYLFLYSDAIFWFSLMILKEKNNLKKILMDGVLDVNHSKKTCQVPMERHVLSLTLCLVLVLLSSLCGAVETFHQCIM